MFNNAPGGSNMGKTLLRLPRVIERTGLSRSTIYLKVSKNLFPHPVSLGPRAVGWLESEIDDWVDNQIRVSRSVKGGQR